MSIVAHEWGHAVQDERPAVSPPLNLDKEPDRLSGGFAQYSATRNWLETGALDAPLALALLSDDPGHGPGWQRDLAFEIGDNGAALAACGLA